MTIRSKTYYDQHAHDQPTQASEWAAANAFGPPATPRVAGDHFGVEVVHDLQMEHPQGPNSKGSGGDGRYLTEGEGIVPRTPERDAALHAEHPGLMRQWMQNATRSDGQNG